jgi:hypothetical protein
LNLAPPGLAEQRDLASRPSMPVSLPELVSLPDRTDAYIQDRFPVRQHFIAALNLVRYQLGYSPLAEVVVGLDGWLFYNAGNFFHHMGARRLDPASLKAWAGRYTQQVEKMDARHASQFFLIAPEKPSIYPELLPPWLTVSDKNEIDDLLGAVPAAARERIVFPRAELLAEKQRQPVFGPYDTHWNGFGAYVAYKALMDRMYALRPEAGAPLPISAFEPSHLERSQLPHNLARMIGIGNSVDVDHPSFATEPQHDPARTRFLAKDKDWWDLQVIETDAPNDLTLLFIRDSFSIELLPFVKRHFKTIVLTHGRQGFKRDDLVERFHPDVVLTEAIETSARDAF